MTIGEQMTVPQTNHEQKQWSLTARPEVLGTVPKLKVGQSESNFPIADQPDTSSRSDSLASSRIRLRLT